MAKKKKKAAKRVAKRAGKRSTKRGQVVAKRAARKKSEGPAVDRSLPESHVALPQADALKTLADAVLGLTASNEQIVREQREHRLTLEMLLESVAKGSAAMDRIEAAQQAPPRDPSLDVPASVAVKRFFFAGACAHLNLVRPTPAIVGRAMHTTNATSRTTARSPYVLFNEIHTSMLLAFGLKASTPAAPVTTARDFIHLDAEMVDVIEDRSKRPKKKHWKFYESQLGPRLRLLVNMRLANVDPNNVGERIDYDRYLTKLGQELFDGWPDWNDTTGGIGILDDVPASIMGVSKVVGPAGSKPTPATMTTPAPEPAPESAPTPAPKPDAGAEPEPTSPAP